MPMRVALLRGINVGGRNRVAMADLRDLFTDLGFTDVKSLLQSGNLVFQGGARKTDTALERLLETETAKRLDVSPDYFIRSAAEWRQIVADNPFPREAKSDPGHLVVMCLKSAPPAAKVYEDVHVFAFMDAGQVNPGHVIVATRQPFETILELDDVTAGAVFRAASRIARALDAAFKPEGITLLQANKPAGWQTVPHFHIHIFGGQPLGRMIQPSGR